MAPTPGTAFVRRLLPLRVRLGMAVFFAKNRWLPGANRWSEGLVRDLEDVDVKAFHKFLWEHHLDRYGLAYEATDLFESGKLNSTVQAFDAFVEDLGAAVDRIGGKGEIDSILDVGCSVGHVLRAIEKDILPDAGAFVGMDIDRRAIAAGTAYLERAGSRIRLFPGDLEQLDALLGGERFDFSYAAGSLSYLDTDDATRSVRAILERTDKLVALIGLANPGRPNGDLDASVFRDELGRMWTHNFERMVEAHGWSVIGSRWEPPSPGDAQGLYSVFAIPNGVR